MYTSPKKETEGLHTMDFDLRGYVCIRARARVCVCVVCVVGGVLRETGPSVYARLRTHRYLDFGPSTNGRECKNTTPPDPTLLFPGESFHLRPLTKVVVPVLPLKNGVGLTLPSFDIPPTAKTQLLVQCNPGDKHPVITLNIVLSWSPPRGTHPSF